MERNWLDTLLLLGLDIHLLLIVGLFALDAAEPAVHRWWDRVRARQSAAGLARPIDPPDSVAATVATLPPAELEPQIATPEWLDRLLSGYAEVINQSPVRQPAERNCRAAEDVA